MSFTDGKQNVATQHDVDACWSGEAPGRRFRCYMCGHKFVVGDPWRFVYMNNTRASCGNALVCTTCDGDDVVERMSAHAERGEKEFWWMR